MTAAEVAARRDRSQQALRALKPEIDRVYPSGRFVAISGGKVVADADSFDQLDGMLRARGLGPDDALVIQAGVEYPEYAVIFSAAIQP
jgi:hypothetical protein